MNWSFANQWSVTVPQDRVVSLPAFAGEAEPSRELMLAALESPYHFEPLRRALTPDDRVCIVLDERLPGLGELIGGVMTHLETAGIKPDAVTLLSPDPHSKQEWIDSLPDEFADVHAEVHHPADRKLLAYVAATKDGEPIYLNRTLVEADFVIVLSAHRFDGPTGEDLVIPGLSDEAHLKRIATLPTTPDEREALWLFGMPFYIRVIEGANDRIHKIVAGFGESLQEADRVRDNRWKITMAKPPSLVVAECAGSSFEELTNTLSMAEKIVSAEGRVAVMFANEIEWPAAVKVLQSSSDAEEAVKVLKKSHLEGTRDAIRWAECAGSVQIFIAGPVEADICEEMFAVKLESGRELQRLIDTAGDALFLHQADRIHVVFSP